MRRLGIAIAIIVVIIVVAVLIFLATFDVNQYHGRIQAELESRLGRQVSLGQMHLGLFPPSFKVNQLSIADDPSFHDPKPFVQATGLDVSVDLIPLFHKRVEINSLSLDHPEVELIKNRDGSWNFASLGKPVQGRLQPSQKAGEATGTQPSASYPVQQFSLAKLSIRDGQVAISDAQAHKPRSVYSHIDASLTDFVPGRPFTMTIAAHMPGAGSQEVRLQGTGGPLAAEDPATTPFHGTLGLTGVSLSGLSQFLNSPALVNTDGILSGETKINSDSGKLLASGAMNIQNPRVRGLDVGYPITANYDLSDDLRRDLITVSSLTMKLGNTPLSVNGTVNTKPTPAELDLNLKATDVSIAEAARLASAFGLAFSPGATVNGQATANIHAQGAADKPALNGTLSARNVKVTGKDIPQPVQVPAVSLALTPQEIRSDNFDVISGGTTVSTNFALRQYTSKTPFIAATAQAPNAQLPAILAMAKAWGVTGLDKISGLGTLNLDMHLAGPVQSITSDQITRALNGNLNLNFNNVRVNGTDVSHQLATIAGFLKPGEQDKGFTNILKMTGHIVVNHGVAQTKDLQALLDIGNVGATGTANLASQALNLAATAVLSKATSQQVGGTGIGGFMNTALANNQGEIVIPVLVSGTLQNPRFTPDLQKLAQMRLKGALPNFENPGSAVSGILGGLLGQKNPNAQGQQQQQQPPQNAVQQILEGILGNKKKPPDPPK